MGSSPRRAYGTPAQVVLLFLAALAEEGSAQPVSEPGSESSPPSFAALRAQMERAELHAEAVRVEESQSGPLSSELIDELLSLGFVYQEIGNYDLAIESLERALQVHRVNYGLSSLDQVPMFRQLIAVQQARGDWPAVRDLQQRLVRLARAHPNELETAPLLQEAAEREMALYRRHLAGEIPPQLSFNFSLGGARSQVAPPAGRMALRRAQRYYSDAIGVYVRAGRYRHAALRELEKALIHSYYLELTAEDLSERRNTLLYNLGRQAHSRLVEYRARSNASAAEFASALVELADWDLLFSQNGRAIDQYRDAYDLLAQHGAAEELERLFRPATPIPIPAAVHTPPGVAAPSAEQYIEVVFDVSKYGRSRRVDVLGVTDDASAAAKEAARFVSGNRFRPRFDDGEPIRASDNVVRFPY